MSKPSQSKGIRIIAGQWRGRRLPVLELAGLRPSGDRLRETLFNWLQMELRGASCLDLFAGTGALGFEAASRGVATVLMLEKHPQAVQQLEENKRKLKADNITVMQADTISWLEQERGEAFDIIFLDPPFSENWQQSVLKKLLASKLLASGGLVYVESSVSNQRPKALVGLQEIKHKHVAQVRMQLFEFSGN